MCDTCISLDTVERVQRRFTKCLHGLRSMSYAERLKYLNIPSLELRRLHADLFWCYEIVFGLAKVQSDLFFLSRAYILSHVARNTNSTNVTIMSACDLHSSLSVSLILVTGYQAMLILVHYHALSEVSSV